MNDQTPRLAGFRGAGQTLKPDELLNSAFTITDSQATMRRDGTTAHKWTVQHADGTLGLYWAPGMEPPHQVQQWFRTYPGRPLHVTLARHIDGGNGYPRWELRQIEDDAGATRADADDIGGAAAMAAAGDRNVGGDADTDPDSVPF